MLAKGLSLRGLEVFEALAETGSVAAAAERLGLSQPAVSQQIAKLEAALGVALIDHARRPMQPTPAGEAFLRRARAALAELRSAQSELTVMDLAHLSDLSMGVIDDFDADLTPRLVAVLSQSMARCRFRLVSAPSHEITDAMVARRLQMAVVATDGAGVPGLTTTPLMRDPFILVCPAGQAEALGGVQAVMAGTPMMRHDRDLLIGRMVAAWLARQPITVDPRFEIGPHMSLMTLVARGSGWTITTALGYMRAARLHGETEAHPLPWDPFARVIALLSSADLPQALPGEVAATMRRLLGDGVMGPARTRMPWLGDDLRLLTG